MFLGKKLSKPKNVANMIHSFAPYPEIIEIWGDSQIWAIENDDCFSEWFFQKISQLRSIVVEFVKEGYIKAISDKFGYDYQFLRNLAFWLAETEDIIEALFKANGWQGRIGLELASAELRIFHKLNGRKPTQRDPNMDRIVKAVTRKKYWSYLGVHNWNDLLNLVFKETNHEMNYYQGVEGLKRAKLKVLRFYGKHNRSPNARDEGMSSIVTAINRGEWTEFGIMAWNDLLEHILGNINRVAVLYRGADGLVRAKEKLLAFEALHGRKPVANDEGIGGIGKAITRGFWVDLGINTWNELLLSVFGEVNQRKGLYTGPEGLKIAKEKLLAFQTQYKRKPTRRDKGLGGIASACKRGYWREFDITSWNELLLWVFGEVNQRTKKPPSK